MPWLHVQVQQYALWRLRDQPGQRPLAHFSPQPQSRSTAAAADQAPPPRAWHATPAHASTQQQQQHTARPVINLDLGVVTPKQAGAMSGTQPEQSRCSAPGSLHELVRRHAGAAALPMPGAAGAAPAPASLQADGAEAAGQAVPEALFQMPQEAQDPGAKAAEGGASGAAAAPPSPAAAPEEGPWQRWADVAAAASDSEVDTPEEALEWAEVAEDEPLNAEELDTEMALGDAAASEGAHIELRGEEGASFAASKPAAALLMDAVAAAGAAPAGAPDQDMSERAPSHGVAASAAMPDQASAARHSMDVSDRAAQAIAAAARARCDVLRGPPRRLDSSQTSSLHMKRLFLQFVCIDLLWAARLVCLPLAHEHLSLECAGPITEAEACTHAQLARGPELPGHLLALQPPALHRHLEGAPGRVAGLRRRLAGAHGAAGPPRRLPCHHPLRHGLLLRHRRRCCSHGTAAACRPCSFCPLRER